MATIQSNGQSYLETQGMDARNEMMARSDYNANYDYGDEATGYHGVTMEEGGKGTGDFSGHGHTVPDMTKPKDQLAYGNFNTSDGGNECDRSARNVMQSRSIYNAENAYGIDIVPDTSANVADGQYDGSVRSRMAYNCPVV